jgi:hypothetical protein
VRRGAPPPDVSAEELEAWLLGAGLAARTPSGLLTPTALGVELGGALDTS